MADFKLIDNFLEDDLFASLHDEIMGFNLPWYKYDSIADPTDRGLYFTHSLYDSFTIRSDLFYKFAPLIDFLSPKALVVAKLNLFMGTEEVKKHGMHIDHPFPHKGAVFYINTNDGVTTFEDGTEVNSVANRLMLFDSSKPHCSSSCSDELYRISLNVTYF